MHVNKCCGSMNMIDAMLNSEAGNLRDCKAPIAPFHLSL